MASTDARPIPIKNTAYRAVFPILDADGDLVTGAASLDSEVSKDQGTFADCTNEATEIATSSGMYYLDLTSTEMNADCVAVIVKTATSGAKTTVLVFYPQESGDIKTDVQSYGGSAGTFSGGRPEVNVSHLAGDATAAANLKSSASVIYEGTVTGASPTTTTLVDSGLTQSGTDHFKGRVIIFLTGSLKYQASDITAFTPGTDTLTFTALTAAPAQSDTYVIV